MSKRREKPSILKHTPEPARPDNGTEHRLPEAVAVKVRQVLEQVTKVKQDLATMHLQYRNQEDAYRRSIVELDARASGLVNEAAVDLGMDPANCRFDWTRMVLLGVRSGQGR